MRCISRLYEGLQVKVEISRAADVEDLLFLQCKTVIGSGYSSTKHRVMKFMTMAIVVNHWGRGDTFRQNLEYEGR